MEGAKLRLVCFHHNGGGPSFSANFSSRTLKLSTSLCLEMGGSRRSFASGALKYLGTDMVGVVVTVSNASGSEV